MVYDEIFWQVSIWVGTDLIEVGFQAEKIGRYWRRIVLPIVELFAARNWVELFILVLRKDLVRVKGPTSRLRKRYKKLCGSE